MGCAKSFTRAVARARLRAGFRDCERARFRAGFGDCCAVSLATNKILVVHENAVVDLRPQLHEGVNPYSARGEHGGESCEEGVGTVEGNVGAPRSAWDGPQAVPRRHRPSRQLPTERLRPGFATGGAPLCATRLSATRRHGAGSVVPRAGRRPTSSSSTAWTGGFARTAACTSLTRKRPSPKQPTTTVTSLVAGIAV